MIRRGKAPWGLGGRARREGSCCPSASHPPTPHHVNTALRSALYKAGDDKRKRTQRSRRRHMHGTGSEGCPYCILEQAGQRPLSKCRPEPARAHGSWNRVWTGFEPLLIPLAGCPWEVKTLHHGAWESRRDRERQRAWRELETTLAVEVREMQCLIPSIPRNARRGLIGDHLD